MDAELTKAITEFGALGVLCIFSYILLRAALKQSEKLGELLTKQLQSILDHQVESTNVLRSLCDEQKRQASCIERLSENSAVERGINAKS